MTTTTIDVRDRRPALEPDILQCHTCRTVMHLYEVFDGWDTGVERDCCPNCQGSLLPPLVSAR